MYFAYLSARYLALSTWKYETLSESSSTGWGVRTSIEATNRQRLNYRSSTEETGGGGEVTVTYCTCIKIKIFKIVKIQLILKNYFRTIWAFQESKSLIEFSRLHYYFLSPSVIVNDILALVSQSKIRPWYIDIDIDIVGPLYTAQVVTGMSLGILVRRVL